LRGDTHASRSSVSRWPVNWRWMMLDRHWRSESVASFGSLESLGINTN
jgi:hypothetical protein